MVQKEGAEPARRLRARQGCVEEVESCLREVGAHALGEHGVVEEEGGEPHAEDGAGNTSVLLGGATSEGWYPFSWGVDQSNYRTFALDRWTENDPSQDVIIPRLHKNNANNANNRVASTWWLRNGSFLRLKNIEFGYQLPKKFMDKIGFEAARIYIMGYNLAVWDDIKYFDPEAGNANAGLNYPLPRTFTLGLDFTF